MSNFPYFSILGYVDVDIITTFFQLPASEQQCILNAWDNMTNSDSYQTPNQTAAEVVNQLKAACPNSASAIQVLADKITAEKDRYAQQYMNFINTMPQSIKDADAKVRFIFFNGLGQNTLYSFLPKADKNIF